MPETWRKCSSCKKDIFVNQPYYVCSVSTCQGRVTNYVFCSIACWDAHVPVERHKGDSAGAIERKAPGVPATEEEVKPRRILTPGSAGSTSTSQSSNDDEILVVVSKVRKYIADKSGMNTSASAYEALTNRIKRLCDRAIETAKSQGRKTVMDRDVP